jgi:hypothetical protein
MKRLGRWLAYAGLMVSLGGCGSLHLYNKEADVAATSAKSDYDASKVAEALVGERGMLDALEAKEVEAFRKVTLAQRDFELLSLVSESGVPGRRTTSDGLVARLHGQAEQRLDELTSPNFDALGLLKALSGGQRNLRDATTNEARARRQLVSFNAGLAALPACNKGVAALQGTPTPDAVAALINDDSFKPLAIAASAAWRPSIATLGTACGQLLDAREAIAATRRQAGSGQLARAIVDADAQAQALDASRVDAQAAGVALGTAADELAHAQEAAKSASQGVDFTCGASTPVAANADDVAQKKIGLCKALSRLEALGDFGAKVVSQERLARINTVLAALSGIEPAAGDPPLDPSLALLSASSRFAQALKQYQEARTLPPLEPLLIEKQLAIAQLTRALGGIALAQARVVQALAFRDATSLEVDLLLRAKAELGAFDAHPRPPAQTSCTSAMSKFCASMSQLLKEKSFEDPAPGSKSGDSYRRIAYRALALVSESYSVARDRQVTAQVKLTDIDYRDALLRSEAAVAAWDALISVPVVQLQAYHANGWTAQEAAQLLQSVGVVGIAARIK